MNYEMTENHANKSVTWLPLAPGFFKTTNGFYTIDMRQLMLCVNDDLLIELLENPSEKMTPDYLSIPTPQNVISALSYDPKVCLAWLAEMFLENSIPTQDDITLQDLSFLPEPIEKLKSTLPAIAFTHNAFSQAETNHKISLLAQPLYNDTHEQILRPLWNKIPSISQKFWENHSEEAKYQKLSKEQLQSASRLAMHALAKRLKYNKITSQDALEYIDTHGVSISTEERANVTHLESKLRTGNFEFIA